MKITFIFTHKPDLAEVPRGSRFSSSFELRDAVKSLPDIQSQIIALSELVAQFTTAYVHVNCPDLDIKNHPVKLTDNLGEYTRGIYTAIHTTCLYFAGILHFPNGRHAEDKRTLTIYSPLTPSFPPLPKGRFARSFYQGAYFQHDPILTAYSERIQALSKKLLILLNIDIVSGEWRFRGFHPHLKQKSLVKKQNERVSKYRAEQKKKLREAEKLAAREAKLAEKLAAALQQQPPLTHGAGRVVGARPGIYNGIQMRSQLEIRFAAELDERRIKWVYEGEALSDSSYLVDFYLPDLGVWVEVKGKFEARDRQVLPTVAKYLKTERQHRLLVYTGSGKCWVVNPSGFRDVERKNFWGELLR